ncbi:MAG: phage head morphogenesis protein [Treponema sp.]|jgi:hypothetical protein|nr:phage head morphogenesis protein [Treponema sp.]
MPDSPEPTLAIQFLERKNRVPTDTWDELKWGEHAHAFTVAHSVEADVLNTLHGLMKDAIKNGEAYGSWRNKALELMKASGWYGGNGHTAEDKKYINWRLRIIYDTNMRTAYSAAQYRKQLQDAEGRPIWVYKSKLAGKNRRQEHIALHDKAFRYDDPFWNTYYPPNGWGCQCSVTTKSVSGAKRDGIETLTSGPSGEPPEIKDSEGTPIDWSTFGDPTWKYNVGREALAPNFNKYSNLPKETVTEAQARYHRDMNQTRLAEGEFKVLVRRTQEVDYKPSNILYQVGNIEAKRCGAMNKHGVRDSKIMASDHDLWHGTGDKVAKQTIPERLFDELYTLLQEPQAIYEERVANKPYRVFHFIKDTQDGKKIKVVVYYLKLKGGSMALKITTMGYAPYQYHDAKYSKIW